MIKLLAIDVDGTLLDSHGRLPRANREALDAAAARGIRLVIVTGRSFHFALPAVEALPEPLLLILHNGAIVRARTGETLLRRLLPCAVARRVLVDTLPWRESAALIFDRPLHGQMIYDRMDWTHPNRIRFRERNLDIIAEVPALEDALTEDPIQITFNGEMISMRAVMASLERYADGSDLAVSLTEYAHRDFSLVDVCAAGTTKGQTLARLAEMLGIAREEILAIGDNFNDRDMLEWAGVGVVMGNAADELRAAGFAITGTNDEAGLAAAIRKFAL